MNTSLNPTNTEIAAYLLIGFMLLIVFLYLLMVFKTMQITNEEKTANGYIDDEEYYTNQIVEIRINTLVAMLIALFFLFIACLFLLVCQ